MPAWAVLLIGIASGLIGVLVFRFVIYKYFWPKQGKWAINLKPLVCSICRTRGPRVRLPKSKRELMWGGWTCRQCGTELDKFGQPVEKSA